MSKAEDFDPREEPRGAGKKNAEAAAEVTEAQMQETEVFRVSGGEAPPMRGFTAPQPGQAAVPAGYGAPPVSAGPGPTPGPRGQGRRPAPMGPGPTYAAPGQGSGFLGGPAPRPPRTTQPQEQPLKPVGPTGPAGPMKPKGGSKNTAGTAMRSPIFWIVAAGAVVVGLVLGTLLGVFVLGDRGGASALEAEIEQQEAELAGWKSKAAKFEEKNETLSAELREKTGALTALEEEAAQAAEDLAALEEKLVYKQGEGAAGTTASFGDGTHLVGSDIQPGTYRSSGGDHCYWTRLSGTGGTFAEIIANDHAKGPAVVTIGPGDVAFESYGCGTWTPAD